MRFETPIRVRFYELDPYNHVNHSAYIQYFETGRIELLSDIGFDLSMFAEKGFQLVVVALRSKFVASAGPQDALTVETWVGEIRRAGSTWKQRIMRGDEVIATQEVDAAVLTEAGKPTRFPEALAVALAPYIEA